MAGAGLRLDLLLLDCLGTVAVSIAGPRAELVWRAGLREIAQEKLRECGVPTEPVTAVDAARKIGLLGSDPNIIDVKPVRPNRKKRRAPRVSP